MRVNVVNAGQERTGEGERVNVVNVPSWALRRALLSSFPVSLLADSSSLMSLIWV